MKKNIITIIFLVIVLSAFIFIKTSYALIINEVEPNDTLGTAQNINSHFSLGYNYDIVNSTTVPWVSILGTGNDTYDWYSFSVPYNSTCTFDIDYGMNDIDTILYLYTSGGSYITNNDDYGASPGYGYGTIHQFDSYLSTYLPAGDYGIKVTAWPGGPVYSGSDYTLQVSIPNHSVVPEPTSIGLVSLGMLGFGFIRKKRV